jgi:HK97 family phage portal protein
VGIIEKITSSLGLVTKAPSSQAAEAGFLPSIGAAAHSATGLVISQSTALAVSAVYACVTIRAQDGARCRPKLIDLDKSGPDSVITDHPLAQILRRPNPQQTWFEFFEQMDIAYLLRGNAYAVIKRDSKGRPTALVPINPDGVTIYESAGGEVFYNVSRIGLWQMAMLAGFPPQIHSSDMLHLRGPSFSTLYGLSTIALGRDSIGLAMGLEQQSARFMANGARPSMVLESEKRVEHSLAIRLGQQFRDAFVGVKNTGGIPVLEDGLKAKPLQLTGVDIQFIEQRKMQVEDVARYWRMPMHKLGVGTAGSNRAQADQDYVSNTIMPDLHRWEEKLDQTFGLYEQGLAVDLDEGVLLRADVATRYANNRIALGGGAWATVNEIRASEGLSPVDEDAEGADQVMRPQNMAAIGSDKTGTAPDGAGHPFDAEGGVPGADIVPSRNPSPVKARRRGWVEKSFNRHQPRDESGRWLSVGVVSSANPDTGRMKIHGAGFDNAALDELLDQNWRREWVEFAEAFGDDVPEKYPGLEAARKIVSEQLDDDRAAFYFSRVAHLPLEPPAPADAAEVHFLYDGRGSIRSAHASLDLAKARQDIDLDDALDRNPESGYAISASGKERDEDLAFLRQEFRHSEVRPTGSISRTSSGEDVEDVDIRHHYRGSARANRYLADKDYAEETRRIRTVKL